MSSVPLTAKLANALLEPDRWACDWDRYFESTTYFPKSSASETIQGKVTLRKVDPSDRDIEMFFKIMPDIDKFESETHSENRHIIEPFIYRYLSNLIYNDVTPNLMEYMGLIDCPNDIRTILDRVPGMSDQILPDWISLQEDPTNTHTYEEGKIMLIEIGKGKTLKKMIADPDEEISKREFLNILFQVFYTLHQMTLVHIRHNDIHCDNVWVNILDDPVTMYYKTSNGVYKIETRYLVKIFDFDLSAYVGINHPPDPVVDDLTENWAISQYFCDKYGGCQFPDPLFDIALFGFDLFRLCLFKATTKRQAAKGDWRLPGYEARWAITDEDDESLSDGDTYRFYVDIVECIFTDHGIDELIKKDDHYSFPGRYCYTDDTNSAISKKRKMLSCDNMPVDREFVRDFDDMLTQCDIFHPLRHKRRVSSRASHVYTSVDQLSIRDLSKLNKFDLTLKPNAMDKL